MSDDSYDEFDFEQAHDLTKKRQRFKRRPKRTSDILSQLMARKGYGQTQTSSDLDETWKEIVGTTWHSKTRVGTVKRGVLEVFVINSAVHQRLGFQKKKLLSQLQQRMPQNNISDIKFRIGSVESR